eukprot:gene6467-6233_t
MAPGTVLGVWAVALFTMASGERATLATPFGLPSAVGTTDGLEREFSTVSTTSKGTHPSATRLEYKATDADTVACSATSPLVYMRLPGTAADKLDPDKVRYLVGGLVVDCGGALIHR